ncbi:factor H binding protein domain-containing protein [Paenalcaligenes sp. Me131]|uniref:factor H binding protein domain-containing protein n=1 Tax=Paenalcaligenes sp. Me131 TaxID=3392636 RepID=UPI003D286E70
MGYSINKIAIYTGLALLAGCSSSGGGGKGSEPIPPVTDSSLSSVPAEYRDAVRKAKTFDPLAILREDLADEGATVKSVTLNGQTLSGTGYNFSELKNGLQDLSFTLEVEDSQQAKHQVEGKAFLYQQPYSLAMGSLISKMQGAQASDLNVFYVDSIKGLQTTSAAIAGLDGQFTYQGVAFSGSDEGKLSYVVDFGSREGSGQISGLTETGNIDLLKASIANLNQEMIQGMGIVGKATFEKDPTADISYELGFFGPNAEEIAGRVNYVRDGDNVHNISEVGFGGKR